MNEDAIFKGIEKCISEEMNARLSRQFTTDDIYAALRSMSPLKASRPDDLGEIFYQKFWHIVGVEVSQYCIDLIQGNTPLSDVNHTHIVLIPKVKSPKNTMQYRLISLYNVVYKIASKAIVNRF